MDTAYGVHPAAFVNSAGLPDLLLPYTPYAKDQPTGRPVLFLHNAGQRKFEPVKSHIAATTIWPRNHAVGDFDGDGLQDVVLADHGFDAPPFPGGVSRLFMQRSGELQDETDMDAGLAE